MHDFRKIFRIKTKATTSETSVDEYDPWTGKVTLASSKNDNNVTENNSNNNNSESNISVEFETEPWSQEQDNSSSATETATEQTEQNWANFDNFK